MATGKRTSRKSEGKRKSSGGAAAQGDGRGGAQDDGRGDDLAEIKKLLARIDEMSAQQTDGKWLEEATVLASKLLPDWRLVKCEPWREWKERKKFFPKSSTKDLGIDLVGTKSNGDLVAIQCKARKLDDEGAGNDIDKHEINSFTGMSASSKWSERWVVTNGAVGFGMNAREQAASLEHPLTLVNIAYALRQQEVALSMSEEECEHCDPDFPESDTRKPRQTRTCMQKEAVDTAVETLREHQLSDSGGLPQGEARGKIILPCGTGKTRISLRIVEKLTYDGNISVVLCPSIALVAQIRREYLNHTSRELRPLAVCSDETAGYDPKKEGSRSISEDPTMDVSNVSSDEIKGQVTTDSKEIAAWIKSKDSEGKLNVIFGTYQSGHRIAEALRKANARVSVLVADEAHRTAGLPRHKKEELNKRIKNFSLCHDRKAFPAEYRIYQTASPRVYGKQMARRADARDYIVRSMDDETIFGVDLYRKSYIEAVNNGWLSDYRIIAVGVNDKGAYKRANELARHAEKMGGRRKLVTRDFMNGLAFTMAMGGATDADDEQGVPIKSCIAFMNTVAGSKEMAKALGTPQVRKWLQGWLDENAPGAEAAKYTLEHVDASSNVTARDNAKDRLAKASAQKTGPHGVLNVGIFGEGTDSPSLSAVAFLEPRKSPVDVIQAVGRAMRRAKGKQFGYIIVPILIPPDQDPEQWLMNSNQQEWEALGQILLALRAHDERIEDQLEDLMFLSLPPAPERESTITAIGNDENQVEYFVHEGPPGSAELDICRKLEGEEDKLEGLFRAIDKEGKVNDKRWTKEPTRIVTGKKHADGQLEVRTDAVPREKPQKGEMHGRVNHEKARKHALDMINEKEGRKVIEPKKKRPEKKPEKDPEKEKEKQKSRAEQFAEKGMLALKWSENSNAIKMNLLEKSGLTSDRVTRDLNLLRDGVEEAARHLDQDGLKPVLDGHFGIDRLQSSTDRADGTVVASLLLMNAAMLHQRIANGSWLRGVESLGEVRASVNIVRAIDQQWSEIMSHDFKPVIKPALKVIHEIEKTSKLAGLERALRHLASEAEHIAETYADMGADHAGALFNKVMGDQSSDGAFFTRPTSGSLLARLTLDAAKEKDTNWTLKKTWKQNVVLDPACGSGTLLQAMLADMKRRAAEQGANEKKLAELHRLAVEETLKGLDINPVSLQLAASRLTAGNQEIKFRKMGLHLMEYGQIGGGGGQIASGTLELLSQRKLVGDWKLDIADKKVESSRTWDVDDEDVELEEVVDDAINARIVIMNPPFTSRGKMGEKFPSDIQKKLRGRVDALRDGIAAVDPEIAEFGDKTSLGPMFVALADKAVPQDNGVMAMVHPTIALSNPSGLAERRILADRFHIHTVLTCHDPSQKNLSENTNINESLIVAKRQDTESGPTRFIALDRFPTSEPEVDDLYAAISQVDQGHIPRGWGEISFWATERMEAGDWTPGIWRAPELAEAAHRYANDGQLTPMKNARLPATRTDLGVSTGYSVVPMDTPGGIRGLSSTSTNSQTSIQSQPDGCWARNEQASASELESTESAAGLADPMLRNAGHLLITASQDAKAGRVTAVANDDAFVGNGWMPVPDASPRVAKALAVFLNSTPGRLQLMRNLSRKLAWPLYRPKGVGSIRIPDPSDERIIGILADCWERTKEMEVPTFGEGECEVRRLWDEAVAEAMGWDAEELGRLRNLLHKEPHVSGVRYGHYS